MLFCIRYAVFCTDMVCYATLTVCHILCPVRGAMLCCVPRTPPFPSLPFTMTTNTPSLRYFLELGGADSAALVWLNGVFVGAAKDSRLPSEWEVTHLLTHTDNLLAVQVRLVDRGGASG